MKSLPAISWQWTVVFASLVALALGLAAFDHRVAGEIVGGIGWLLHALAPSLLKPAEKKPEAP